MCNFKLKDIYLGCNNKFLKVKPSNLQKNRIKTFLIAQRKFLNRYFELYQANKQTMLFSVCECERDCK